MSFQAYLDNIKAKTGKTPDDFRVIAEENGLLQEGTKTSQIVAWLKADFDLGHGHAMAIVQAWKSATHPKSSLEEQIDRHFGGSKASWRNVYNQLVDDLQQFGPDITISPTQSYISLVRNGKKFAIVQVTSDRMDLGIKLKGKPAEGRLEEAGKWNAMVTHRVRLDDPNDLDPEVIVWLRQAYDKA